MLTAQGISTSIQADRYRCGIQRLIGSCRLQPTLQHINGMSFCPLNESRPCLILNAAMSITAINLPDMPLAIAVNGKDARLQDSSNSFTTAESGLANY